VWIKYGEKINAVTIAKEQKEENTKRRLCVWRKKKVIIRDDARRNDRDFRRWFAAFGPDLFDLSDDVHALDHLTEDDVPTIEPWCRDRRHEELWQKYYQ